MTELKRLSRQVVYSGKVFDLIVDQVEYPSGIKGIREIAHHPGGSVVIPVLDDGNVLLVKQLRYPFGRHIYELPAGKLSPDEDPAIAAARELEEETGYLIGTLKHITSIYSTPGFCDEVLHLYLATGLHISPTGHKREEGEKTMTVHSMPLQQALTLIENCEIVDAKTIVGLFWLERLRGEALSSHENSVHQGRMYAMEIRRCLLAGCGGELKEISFHERNNWATAELQCGTCKRRFVLKAEC
jgi:ADP-ribose pyrophosphatase